MDAFVAAISVPTVVSAVLVSSLSYVVVPLLSERLVAASRKQPGGPPAAF